MASRSWNRVELIGNITRDPELRYTPNGAAVATFSIATNRTYMVDGERKEEADFHRCVAWNKLAELCSQLLKKGNRVFVSGRLQNRSWDTPEGQNRQITEIVVEDMILLTSAGGASREDSYSEEIPVRNVETPKTTEVSNESKDSEESKVAETEPEAKEEDKKQTKATEDVGDLDDLPF